MAQKINEDLENRFTYHTPKEGQPEQYVALRVKAKELAYLINAECPASREASLAITHLETAVFWANAALARHGEAKPATPASEVSSPELGYDLPIA